MSNQAAAYTPLETLLLFHQLRKRGVESSAFNGISDDLRAIPLIKNDPTYDAARLSPEALRDLYLQLLKDEAKRDLERHLDAPNGELSPTSRKRKAPSPKLPSIHEAAKHSHLIPQLITRLYTRWREITVTQIREHEAKYERIVQEISEIKAGKWDEKLQQPVPALSQTSRENSISALVQPDNSVAKAEKKSSQARLSSIDPGPASVQGRGPPSIAPQPQYMPQPHIAPAYQHVSPSAAQVATFPAQNRSSTNSPALAYVANRASASPRPILPPQAAHATSPHLQSPTTFQAQPRLQPYPAQQHPAYANAYQNVQPAYYQQQQYQNVRPAYQQYALQPQSAGYVQQYPNSGYQDPSRYQHVQQQQNQYSTPQQSPHAPRSRLSMHEIIERLKHPQTPATHPRTPVWKSESKPVPMPRPASPTRPTQFEPVSPVLAHVTPSPTRTRTRKQKQESVANSDDLARRTRSVSLSSMTADEKPQGRRRVKQEPSTPYVADSEEPEAQPGASLTTRTRRGISFQGKGTSTTKRRRQQSPEEEQDEPPPRPTTIMATRNFAKLSSTLMNGIIGHKHGSRFAQAVKDVDGYTEFVKRPQDLKNIRAMIAAGNRALTTLSSNLDSPAPDTPGGTKSSENVLELEKSAELMPPKAIVNGAQLEKEIMRMLANAVMFNPGEDGMVADTREMFDRVEELIDQWRGIERDTGTADEEEEGTRKKRKL